MRQATSHTSDRRRGFLLRALPAAAAIGLMGAGGLARGAPVAPRSDAAPLAQRLAEYVHALGEADIDAATLEALKLRLVDTFGCALAALDEPVIARCFGLADASGPAEAALIGTRRRGSAELAAFANGAAIRYYDLNDGYLSKEAGHPSDHLSVCLAVAQSEGRSITDFIVSAIAAYEIECRLFDAASLSARGWDNPSYGVVTAALTAGKLMRLPVEQLTQAVNIALVDHVAMNQTRVQVLSNWKGLADASASRSGVFAARLAREGITGPSPIFEGTMGFNRLVAGAGLELDTAGFGTRGTGFRIHDVLVKPYPAQGHTITAVESAIRLSKRIPDRNQIERVLVATTQFGYRFTGSEREMWAPATKESADHSMPYVVARALLDGTITNASYAEANLAAPDVRALMAKIKVVEDPVLTAMTPRKIPNRVSVTLKSGETLTEQAEDLWGSSRFPLTRAGIEEKFWRTAGSAISRPHGEQLLSAIWSLEKATSVDELFEAAAQARQG
ncbi:MmgE/PrpD family protein [Cupriavidus sp. USMAHM13]|uniref:MmgE/PrpD family protein n=2 Tax=Pseudomonadota TaxID=1224 RepID=UPI000B12F348|nr:MmgE/PrpD family protein [Cupriavidus sp. USMAHM13]